MGVDKKGVRHFICSLIARFSLFLTLFIIGSVFALAAHTSSVNLQPQWTPPNTNVSYTSLITNNGPDSIKEVRIFSNNLYSQFLCQPEPSWSKVEVTGFPDEDLGIVNLCWYFTGTDFIPSSLTEDFQFSAVSPGAGSSSCNLTWKFETRDVTAGQSGQWFKVFVNTSVDDKAPLLEKTVQGPQYGTCPPSLGEDCWVTPQTTINVDVVDDSSCEPKSLVDHCEFTIKINGVLDDHYTLEAENGEVHTTINFGEPSAHELNITCVDNAGNVMEDVEVFKVDPEAPETTKHFNGPQKFEEGIEWIDGVTTVTLNPVDPDPNHASGLDKTWYANSLAISLGDEFEESCWSPAETCGDYSIEEPNRECVESAQSLCSEEFDRDLNFNAWADCVEDFVHDEEVGCDADSRWKLYRGTPIAKDEESCHILQFYSIDNIGNVEDGNPEMEGQQSNFNCFFVDKTKPTLTKDNGKAVEGFDPDPPISGPFHYISPTMPITFTCTDGGPHPSGDEQVCFKVTFDKTPFILTSLYATEYGATVGSNGFACVNVNQANQFVFNFNEEEDSNHSLEYYCRDAVNKTTVVHTQWYKVDAAPPVITKTLIGPTYAPQGSQCPPRPNSNDICYIKDNTESPGTIVHVDVQDNAGEHDSGVDYCTWTYTVNGVFAGGNEELEVPFDIIFPEDSNHVLTINCFDNLGNSVQDVESFIVDSIAPNTTKEYGLPYFDCKDWCEVECAEYDGYYDGDLSCVEECLTGVIQVGIVDEEPIFVPTCGGFDLGGHYYPVWINSSTSVELTAEDLLPHPVGVKNLSWRNLVITNPEGWEACRNVGDCDPEFYEQFLGGQVETPFTTILGDTTTFYKEEESCHVIEYYATDLLGNEEIIKRQCAFVDNTAPTITKEVGEPKKVVCNQDEEESQEQPSISPQAIGGNLREITGAYSQSCSINTGLAFDGTNLIVSCWDHNNLDFINPADGSLVGTLDVPGYTGLHANAWDATRGMLWQCAEHNKILLVDTTDGSSTPYTHDGIQCTDGLAYDGTDDTLWISPDVSGKVYHYQINGDATLTNIGTHPLGLLLGGVGNSGIAVGGPNLYLANNGDSQIYTVPKDFSSSTLFSSFPRRLEDLECDDLTFASQGVGAIWSQDAYDRIINAWEIPQGLCGFGGLPSGCQGDEIVYVSPETPITFSCVDEGPHPVDHVSIHWRVAWDDENNGFTEDEWSEWELSPYEEHTIYLTEDSHHKIEYYCTDALGNTGPHLFEDDIVDAQAPEITKTVVGPQVGQCPPRPGTDDVCIIDGVTKIHVEAVDPDPHPVGDVTCEWSYRVLDGEQIGEGQIDVIPPFDINFPEESTHELAILCTDGLRNTDTDVEIFQVDKTPPTTTKEYGLPRFTPDGDMHNSINDFINDDTEINLTIEDTGVHKSGLNDTFYRVTLVEDTYCDGQEQFPELEALLVVDSVDVLDCEDADGSGPFLLYNGPFNIDEESCHLIEYYSVDDVNKTELTKRQCVFVDPQAPTPNTGDQKVGEPKSIWNGADAVFYNISGKCWNGGVDEIECYRVTLTTPLNLSCNDPDPHPSGHEEICFNIEVDAEDMTSDYCDIYGSSYDEETGYCCADQEITDFRFQEETEHNLKFYCTDAVGNVGPVDDEKFKVEGGSFQIDLFRKWNLISVPFPLLNDSPAEVFKDMKNVSAVWTYDGEANGGLGAWLGWSPDVPEFMNDLEHIKAGWGYWVLEKNDQETLTLGGSLFKQGPVLPAAKPLVPGWNLIGFYGTQWQRYAEQIDLTLSCGEESDEQGDVYGSPVYCSLNSLVDTQQGFPRWSSLWGFTNCGNHDTEWVGLSTCEGLDTMYAGRGYWVEIDVADSYAPATNCVWNSENQCLGD